MVNEFQYCPRLAYLEWVQGEWAESADTVEGRGVHRRVDRGPGALPEPKEIGDEDRIHARSVTLSSERLGLIAKLDLIEGEDGSLQPVDYKRGRRPHLPAGAWEPELVQLCVQGLILEDNGYRCSEGALYFRESRERVRVRFDDALRSKALAAVHGLRLVAAGGRNEAQLSAGDSGGAIFIKDGKFYKLAGIPNSGHRRTDLTSRKVLFYRIFSYLVIYEPESNPLQILGILHGKRNVSRILRQRSRSRS